MVRAHAVVVQPPAYVASYGSPARISQIDAVTGELLESSPLPGSGGAWGLAVGPDESVYISGNGRMPCGTSALSGCSGIPNSKQMQARLGYNNATTYGGAPRGGQSSSSSRLKLNYKAGNDFRDRVARSIPGAGKEKVFQTSLGGRRVDILTPRQLAIETKVGYTSLSSSIKLQIRKNAELISTNQVNGVFWMFTKSPTTGIGGPSGPLAAYLKENGIGWRVVP